MPYKDREKRREFNKVYGLKYRKRYPRYDIFHLSGWENRFWKWVMPEPNSGCWLWLGSCGAQHYGQFQFHGQVYVTHRISWMLHNGPIPDGLFILHKCDNPPCVNPQHLFLGTKKDNKLDCIAKDRHVRGERNPWAKLTESKVREIRELWQQGSTQTQIAKDFSMDLKHIWSIVHHKSWKHTP